MRKRSKRSQYSMEFLIFFAFLSIVFFIWLVVYTNLNQDAFAERDKKAVTDLGKSIQTHVFTASSSPSGYHSNALAIGKKVSILDYDINFTPYVFYIKAKGKEYVFHIPYTIYPKNFNQYLEKKRKLQQPLDVWSIGGVVAIGPFHPYINGSGHAIFSQCADGIDNDADDETFWGINMEDCRDGACWTNWNSPCYVPDRLVEKGAADKGELKQDSESVFKYYVICKHAHETCVADENNCLCDALDDMPGSPVSKEDCIDLTAEKFCAKKETSPGVWEYEPIESTCPFFDLPRDNCIPDT